MSDHPTVVPADGRVMQLRGVADADAGWIADVLAVWQHTYGLTSAGLGVSPASMGAILSEGVAFQRVLSSPEGSPLGLLQIRNLEASGTARLEVLVHPDIAGYLEQVASDFLGMASRELQLRKLELMVDKQQSNLEVCLGEGARRAGRLIEHHRVSPDCYVDVLVFETHVVEGNG